MHHRLQSLHREITGLANLQWQQDQINYHISWWANDYGVSAGVSLALLPDAQGGWHVKEQQQQQPPSLSDDYLYLCVQGALEGAPPLSENWRLYDDNEALYHAGLNHQAATLIFTLYNSEQTERLVQQIHHLRQQRGDAIKLVVREMATGLRYSDERLLMACGTHLIVPHSATLSRFLTLLEGIQGTRLTRHVPADLQAIISAMQPLQLKGYVIPEIFCRSVHTLMNNALLPEEGKGILVALRPVANLRAEQALKLCHIRRYGDLMTTMNEQLYLFLSSCRMNDLDTALNSIFPLPLAEAFSHRLAWSQDRQISAEIAKIEQSMPLDWRQALPNEAPPGEPMSVLPVVTRRQPLNITLSVSKEHP